MPVVTVWELIKALGVKPDSSMATCCYTALMTDTGRFQYQNATPVGVSRGQRDGRGGRGACRHFKRGLTKIASLASLMLEKAMLEHIVIAEDGLWAFSHVRQSDFERLGAVKADAEPLVDVLRSRAVLRVACMVREQAERRARQPSRQGRRSDVPVLARHIGGGETSRGDGFHL